MSEHKYNQQQSTVTGAATVVILASNLTQGIGTQFRIGDRVTGTSLEVRVHWIMAPASIAPLVQNHVFRFIGWIWKDDSLPTSSDILESDPPAPVTNTLSVLRPLNHSKKVKRKLLWDYMWSGCQLQNAAGTEFVAATNNHGTFKFSVNLTKYARGGLNRINWQPGGTTLAVNHIYYLVITSEGVGAGSFSGFSIYSRYNYIDT